MKRFALISAVVVLAVIGSTLAAWFQQSDSSWLSVLYGSEADRQEELDNIMRANDPQPASRVQVNAEAQVSEIMAKRRAARTPVPTAPRAPAPTFTPEPIPPASPDIQATITAAVEAALAAQSSATPPAPLPTPAPADVSIAAPAAPGPTPEPVDATTRPEPTLAPTVTRASSARLSEDEAIGRLNNYFAHQMFLEFDKSLDATTHAISNQRFIFWLTRSDAVISVDTKADGYWIIEVTNDNNDIDSPSIVESWFVYEEYGRPPYCDSGQGDSNWDIVNSCSVS